MKDAKALAKSYRLCSLHFENEMYANIAKTRILPQAEPKKYAVQRVLPICENFLATTASSHCPSERKEENESEPPRKKIKILQDINCKYTECCYF